jgi:hypothetical protein
MADTEARTVSLALGGLVTKYGSQELARDLIAAKVLADHAADRVSRYAVALCLQAHKEAESRDALKSETESGVTLLH